MSRLIKGKMIRKQSRRIFQRNIAVLFCFMLLFSPFSMVLGEIVEDDMTEGATEITNLVELNEIRNDLDGNYILGVDIDLSEVTDWQSIGSEDKPFNGAFDGSGFKITGMDGTFEEADHGGIFNAVSAEATVQKLVVEFRKEVVEDEEIIKAEEATEDEDVIKKEEVPVDTPVNEKHIDTGEDTRVGDEGEEELSFGLFGGVQPLANGPNIAIGDGTEANPYIIMNETELNEVRHGLDMYFELGQSIVLTNANWEPIGNLTDNFTGSFDGKRYTISNLTINRPTEEYIGLFGSVFEATISNVTLTNVSIVGDSYIGGLIGNSGWKSSVISNSVTGQITGNGTHVGGMVGWATEGELNDNHASVEVKGESFVGGLIGSQYLFHGQYSVINSSARGNVSGKSNVGGLIGQLSVNNHNASITISRSFATGTVTGAESVGGLVGHLGNYNKIFASYARGTVTGDMRVGGLVGNNQGEIQRSFASGNVEGSEKIGGLVGVNASNRGITNSYATGAVDGDVNIGGLVGENTRHSIVKTSYAIGLVSGTTKVGGLVGDNDTGIYNVGVDDSYYDKDTSNQSDDTNKGVPKTTVDMKTQATFTNWDFDDVWDMPAGDYPRLQWEGVGGQPPVVTSDIIYVKENGAGNEDGTSWDNAFATLQAALDEATDGKQIWIAKGMYYPTKMTDATDLRTTTFQMKNGVAIYGGFKGDDDSEVVANRNFTTNETVLSGDLNKNGEIDDDDAYHVFYHHVGVNLNDTAILDGVTITGGNANDENRRHHQEGGGIHNNGSSPSFTNIKVHKNKARYSAGIFNTESSPSLTNVEISFNEAAHGNGGIYNSNNSHSTLTNVVIKNNKSTSGTSGGIRNFHSNPTIINTVIESNEANVSAGMDNYESSPTLINVVISENNAVAHGGGIRNNFNSHPTLINVTIVNNTAPSGTGSNIRNDVSSSAEIKNSIISGGSDSIFNDSNSTTRFSHSLVKGSGGSANWNNDFGANDGDNLDEDPKFVDEANGDYQLKNHSPAIDKGDDSLVPGGITKDLAGNNRFVDNAVDMGAYENQVGFQPLILISAEKFDALEVEYGTEQDDLDLPVEVEITLSDHSTIVVPVTWDDGNPDYDGHAPEIYDFNGKLDLPSHIDNPDEVIAEFRVIVKANVLVPAGDVTVIYIDTNNEEISDPVVKKGNVGEDYTTTQEDIPGYIFKEVIGDKTGKFTINPQEVKYVYTKDKVVVPDKEISARHYDWVPLKTGWYDINDLPLREKVEVSLDDGSKVELAINWNMVSAPVYDKDREGNYLFSGDFVLINGVSNPNGYQAQRLFVLSDVVVTVTHVDEDGNELAPEEKLTGKVGDEYTTEAKEIDGYTLTKVPEYAADKFRAMDLNVKYVYKKNEEDVPDKEITGSLSRGTMFDVGEKELADIITMLPTKVAVTLDDNTEVELNVSKWDVDSDPAYDKDTAGMYVFSGDIELKDGVKNTAGVRAKYSISLNDIEEQGPELDDKKIARPYHHGFTPLKTGVYEQKDLPLPKKVNVSLDDGSKIKLEVVWHANSEPNYDKNLPGQYRFTGEFKLIDGIVNPQGYLATYDFGLSDDDKPATDSIVEVTHVDEAGNELAPRKTLTGVEGEIYQTQLEVINGYTLNKVNGDASGIFTKASIYVEYVYAKDSETPDPVDPPDETDPVKTGKEIVNVPVIGMTFGLGTEDLAGVLSYFPSSVEVTLDDDTVVEVGVKWNEVSNPAYDKNKVGAYIFSGEFILTDGITNPDNHIMIYQVNVFDYDKLEPTEPTDPKELEDPKIEPSEPSDKDKDEEVAITKEDKSTKLPKTATPYYTIIFAGSLLIVIGGAVYLVIRRKRVV